MAQYVMEGKVKALQHVTQVSEGEAQGWVWGAAPVQLLPAPVICSALKG